jgi:hypothetical protein
MIFAHTGATRILNFKIESADHNDSSLNNLIFGFRRVHVRGRRKLLLRDARQLVDRN